jgi:hypothetical protein
MSNPRNVVGSVLAPISVGELFDKIVILEIKATKITDASKLMQIQKELNLLKQIDFETGGPPPALESLKQALKQVNETLWEIEDRIRDREREQDFGSEFVRLARAVYQTNDRRAELKRRINELSGSHIVEVKSYARY